MRDYELEDALRSMIRRARVLKVDDSGSQQRLDLAGLKNERPEEIVRVLPHGFSSVPNAEAEGLMLQLGGRSDRTLFLGGEHKEHRPKNLKVGQAILYDDKGNVVFAKGSDGISINAKTGVVEVRSRSEKVTVKPGEGKNVYLGGDGTDGVYSKVVTEDGPSMNVFARIS